MDNAATYPVAWSLEGRPATVGRLEARGDRIALTGTSRHGAAGFEFGGSEILRVVLSQQHARPEAPQPTLHIDLHGRGWVLITALGSGLAFEIAGRLARLQTT